MNKFQKIIFVLALCLVCTTAASASVSEYVYPIITPWNTSTDFNSSSFDYTDRAASGAQWNLWPSTYTKVCAMQNCIAKTRDSYTDPNSGETVYDSVSGEPGDNYVYFGYADNWTEPSSNANTGYIYYNDKSKANGGLCYGAAAYEFDIKISDIFKEDSNGTKISMTNSANTNVIEIPIKHGADNSWYITYTNAAGENLTTSEFEGGKWYRLSVYADAANQKYVFSVKSHDDATISCGFVSDECSYAAKGTNPLKTTISVQCPKYADTSLDNFSVTKEAFVVEKPFITDDGTNVGVTVRMANTVYAAPGFGDDAPQKSPIVVLVSYDANDKMIAMTAKTATFSGHSTTTIADFTKELEFMSVSLSYNKPSGTDQTLVYVWNGYNMMKPYLFDVE